MKLAALLLLCLALLGGANACTRVSQVLPNGKVQTGRTMVSAWAPLGLGGSCHRRCRRRR